MLQGRLVGRARLLAIWGLAGLCCACVGTKAADVPVAVYVNGKLASWPEKALVRDGKAYAPLRRAAQALGAEIEWHPSGGMAVVCLGDQCVPVSSRQGILVDGRLYVPLRVLAQALRCKVQWDGAKKAVNIKTTPELKTR